MVEKLIFLFLPSIIKNFVFSDRGEVKFINFALVKKSENKKSLKIDDPKWAELFLERVEGVVRENKWKKLVLVNFPRNLKHFRKLKKNLLKSAHIEKKYLMVVNIEKYELIEEILKTHLVCPMCERLHIKTETLSEGVFSCFQGQKDFKKDEVEKFNKTAIDHHLEEIQEVVKEFLKILPPSHVVTVGVSEKEEVLSKCVCNSILTKISHLP